MTIAGRKNIVSKGSAKLLIRILRGQSGLKPDWRLCYKHEAKHQSLFVEFNTKDELELQFTLDKEDIPKINKENVNTVNVNNEGRVVKVETFKIDEIADCVSYEADNFINTLIVETVKRDVKEDLVLKFDNEQEFRRTLFTYKYFKMRNKLANSSSTPSENSDGSSSPSLSTKSKSSINSSEASPVGNSFVKGFDFITASRCHFTKNYNFINNNNNVLSNYTTKSLDYLSVNGQTLKSKSAYEQKIIELNNVNSANTKNSNSPMSDTKAVGEIDGLIYADIEYESMDYNSLNYVSDFTNNLTEMPMKPQRRKQVLKRIKGKAPPPPGCNVDAGKGQVAKVGMERPEKVPTKDANSPMTKCLPTVPRAHIASNGYESDREEWRSRSTFSSSAFHSLARPARRALAAYYNRLSSPTLPPAPQLMTLKPSPRNPRNLQDFPKNFINADYVILSHIQDKRTSFQQDLHQFQNVQQKQELKYGKMLFNQDYKRNTLGGSMNYLNISSKLHGITDKIKEMGQPHYVKPSWQRIDKDKKEKGQLKPVIKKNLTQIEGSKRPVVRSCSAEPPKKVTFSAFATVQVV